MDPNYSKLITSLVSFQECVNVLNAFNGSKSIRLFQPRTDSSHEVMYFICVNLYAEVYELSSSTHSLVNENRKKELYY